MKKLFIVMTVALLLFACSKNEGKQENSTDISEENKTENVELAEELKEYKITGSSFIFRGKELKMGEVFTQKSFEQKFGKSDACEYYPGGFYLVYKKEKMTAFFNVQNKFKGFDFEFSDFKKIVVEGVSINKGDTYMTIRKKLENQRKEFTVIETVDSRYSEIILIINLPGFNEITKIDAKMFFTGDDKKEIITLAYFYEPYN